MTRRARRSVDVRRDEILTATVDLVDRLGLAAVRVGDVAAELGISASLVFYHFGTKDDLVAEAFAHAVERDLGRIDKALAPDDPVEQLRRLLRLYGPTGQAVGWRVWIDAWALAQREPHIRKVLRRLDDRWEAALRQVVEDGVAAGTFTCADPGAAVRRVSALLDGLSVATLVYRTVTRAQLREWVAGHVAHELGLDVDDAALSGGISHQPVRGVVGIGQGLPVEAVRRQVGGRPAGGHQVGEQPSEGRRELEPVRGPEAHHDVVVARHRRQHEVAVAGSACRGSAWTAPGHRSPGAARP